MASEDVRGKMRQVNLALDLDKTRRKLDDAVEHFVTEDPTPGVVVGLVFDGELVHAASAGTTTIGQQRAPGIDTVFRIASMTKSFTAATTLSLRDQGRLGLDDPVVSWLPWFTDTTAEGVPLTVRHVLTMGGGFATDDPWGDRQQDLPLEAFDRLATEGFSTVWTRGTRYEYSNLGYALLGRVLSVVTGEAFDELVSRLLLRPLSLESTTFHAPEDGRLAQGYALDDGQPVPEPVAGYGAFAPMGGLFSTVRDLARWVQGYIDAERLVAGSHPLSAASRREMSQTHRLIGAEATQEHAAAAVRVSASGYGFGLEESLYDGIGRVVSHSGGYPGFGSHMRWHPASGLAVIGLGNRTYSPMRRLVGSLLDEVVRTTPAVPASVSPTTESAVQSVEELVTAWDDERAVRLFADNVVVDEALASRHAHIDRVVDAVGPLRHVEAPSRSDSPAHRAWTMAGDRGVAQLEVLMSPHSVPLITWLAVTAVPQPSARLVSVATAVVAEMNSECPTMPAQWPDGLVVDDGLDAASVTAQLRSGSARMGTVRLGDPVRNVSKAGTTTVAWQILGEHGRAELQLAVSDAGTVSALTLRFAPITTAEEQT
ncbi:MAG: serine hydrolase domain-containing protein [Actinomycetes bacterium]